MSDTKEVHSQLFASEAQRLPLREERRFIDKDNCLLDEDTLPTDNSESRLCVHAQARFVRVLKQFCFLEKNITLPTDDPGSHLSVCFFSCAIQLYTN